MSALQKKLQEARELIDNRKVITNLDPNFDMQAMQAEMAKNLIALEKEINDKNRQLFLKIMIELGSVEGVKKAIEKGADLNQFLPGSGELIALDFAVSKDQTEIVKCLLNLDLLY